jgi:hypothetical protein
VDSNHLPSPAWFRDSVARLCPGLCPGARVKRGTVPHLALGSFLTCERYGRRVLYSSNLHYGDPGLEHIVEVLVARTPKSGRTKLSDRYFRRVDEVSRTCDSLVQIAAACTRRLSCLESGTSSLPKTDLR